MSESAPEEYYFLSYSRSDQDFALRLASDLRAGGVMIWVDQLDIRPSEHWDRAIERAVRDCRGLVVILSPRSAASDNVADEISFAIDHGKTVLPIMFEQCALPLRITRMQVIDATGTYDQALQRCMAAITGGQLGQRPQLASPRIAFGDAEAVASAKAHLTKILGPIASILVDKEAARASSVSDLYSRLAQHIPDQSERERFTVQVSKAATAAGAVAPAPTVKKQSSLSADEINRLSSVLTHYLGPMATVIAKRESAAATSTDDLQQRLALRIADERARTEFLRRVQKA